MFGMVDTSQQPALGYMEVVHARDAATLLPIIQAHTAPGSTIHSDQWAAYTRVQTLGNVATHNSVNHSLHFLDPVTGVHTQNVESYWNRVKCKLKRMKGCHAHQIPSYLDEFLWRERHGKSASTAWHMILQDSTRCNCPSVSHVNITHHQLFFNITHSTYELLTHMYILIRTCTFRYQGSPGILFSQISEPILCASSISISVESPA